MSPVPLAVEPVVVCSGCGKSSTIEHHGGRWCANCGRFASPPDPALLLDEIDIRAWRSAWKDHHVSMADTPRNATLSLLAVPMALARRIIAVGFTVEDAQMPDGKPDFYKSLNELLERSDVSVRVSATWLEQSLRKRDFIEWALGQPHLGEAFVRSTRSCWQPVGADHACGKCPPCEARRRAFKESGLASE